jgi:hypothetical protein
VLIYLVVEPHAADLAAASFRSDLFDREGFTLFSTAWYGGHHTPGYSVLAPPLGALLGNRGVAALSAVAATAAFTALAGRSAGYLFVPAILASVLSGRIAFTLGAAFAIAALLFATRERPALTALAAFCASLASPVAALFLAIAATALFLDAKTGTCPFLARQDDRRESTRPQRARKGHVPLFAGAVVPTAFLVFAFPEGGEFPFVASAFWPAFAAAVGIAVVAEKGPLKIGAALYAAVLAGAFLLDSPVGGNAVRLGTLVVAPVAYLLLWPRHRTVLAVLALPIAYWVLQPAYRDVKRTMNDPSVEAAYHRPLIDFLVDKGAARVEIPLTQNHGEAQHVARYVAIARGWERQLDIARNGLFYEDGPLSPLEYERWLRENAVQYVALPEGLPLDKSGEEEKTLIAREPAFLEPVARRGRWRIFEVVDALPPADGPIEAERLGADSFDLRFTRPGSSTIRVRWTPYWALATGRGCVEPAPGDWTRVRATERGSVKVVTRFAPGRMRSQAPRCR